MKKVGILLFDDIELLDFAGPYEVFAVADELNDHSLFDVFTLSETGKEVRTVHGLRVHPDYAIDRSLHIDILVIPGGDGTKAVIKNKTLLDWFRDAYDKSAITFSVCSGARIPAILGLLDNKEFTTHHAVVEDVMALAPQANYRKDRRFVDNGKLMTAAGISAGIDLALYIVEKLYGTHVKEQTMQYMEYVQTQH